MLNQRLLYYVGRSLFKADRLMYAMHLVHIMFPGTCHCTAALY